ncbi:helix-turn-helix transcriptional regulator [Gelidibacter japonicus]|jgi:ribosome-binding protein aMBF1 (putative translation factor)|uniref:helix-turn-helix domain-containing protein n=1 Tax=Gelidibacter japonicus TaxID=1962232 RepID=UPI002AFECE57|nr:helix-turn-helix transcriptional regulator [Gelidibacter japonicus]
MKKILELRVTQFDFDFINHVKGLREKNGMTKEDLSLKMGLAKSFVGNVESYTQRHKYSTRHIALLAKAFGFKNISDLMKFDTPKYDKILITIQQTMNKSGTKVVCSEVMKIESIK